MTARILSLLALATFITSSGCTADLAAQEADGDVGDTGASAAALTTGCSMSRAEILASVSGGRQRAIERGFRWYDRGIPYNRSASFEGYRTDCSGFASMCWELGRSYNTYDFLHGNAPVERLASYDDLLPGDAIIRRVGGVGHTTVFLGWNDSAKTSACLIEEAGPELDMEFGTRTRASLRSMGYNPVRPNKF